MYFFLSLIMHSSFFPTSISHVYKFQVKNEGPTCAIMGGTHGNEPCGIQLVDWLRSSFLTEHQLQHGTLYVILGNPLATAKGTRFIDCDLNRQFDPASMGAGYEAQRATELKTILSKLDYFLDIHSTSSKSVPMICSANTFKHLHLCRSLPVEYITTGWLGRNQGLATDEFVDACDGIGITVECGSHLDASAFDIAKQAALIFLHQLGCIEYDVTSCTNPKHIDLFNSIYPKTEHFQFTVPSESFYSLKKGDVYAHDGLSEYRAPEDCVMVMPAAIPRVGEEACYLGRAF